MSNPLILDTQTQTLVDHLHRGAPAGATWWRFIWTPNAGATNDKKLSCWVPVGKPLAPPKGWQTGHNLYFGVNPSSQRRKEYEGSTNDTIAGLNCLYAEFDGKDFTVPAQTEIAEHFAELRADPAKAKVKDDTLWKEATSKAKEAKYATDPARYRALALAHVQRLQPAPSVIVDSGGGYQAYWLLRETFHIESDAARGRAKDTQRRWVHFVGGDPGVNDLRRVLRLPGSRNYKKRYAPYYPLATYVTFDLDLQYHLADLQALLPPPAPTPTAPTHRPPPTIYDTGAGKGERVINAYNAATCIEEALQSVGYTRKGRRWIRPGGQTPSVTVFSDGNASYHHNTNDPLYHDKHARSPFDVFCEYEHSGNVRAAVAAAAKQLGMDRPTKLAETAAPNHRPFLAAVKLWARTTSFAEFIPDTLKGEHYRTDATDTKIADAVLCLMEKFNRLIIHTTRRRLAADAAVSGSTALRSLARLHGWLFNVEVSKEGGITITLHPDFRIAQMGQEEQGLTFLAHLRDTNEYSPRKADDPFQIGVSRKVKDRCRDAAIVAGGVLKEWLATTPKGFGETVVRIGDALQRCGEMTTQELGEETGKAKGAIWRACKRLESEGLLLSSREGSRAPKVYDLVPDFWRRIDELAPTLRTHGLRIEREDRRLKDSQLWVTRQQLAAITAGDKATHDKLERRLTRLGNQRLKVLGHIYPEMAPADLEALAFDVQLPTVPHPALIAKMRKLHANARVEVAAERRQKEQKLRNEALSLWVNGADKYAAAGQLMSAGYTPTEAWRTVNQVYQAVGHD